MKLFKLVPIESNIKDSLWSLSLKQREVFRDTVIVRAESEDKARTRVAVHTYEIAPLHELGRFSTYKTSPWLLSSHVDCNEYSNPDYNPEGDEEILSPSFLED